MNNNKNNPNYHQLLIRSSTREEKEQAALDSIMGDAIVDRIKQMEGRLPWANATINGQQELTGEQRARLPYVLAMGYNCFVCDADPPPAGMYTWVVRGETVITPICVDCHRTIGIKDRIKRGLERKAA